jgi:hypothetical protein
MGQAKHRGSFEERRQQSIDRTTSEVLKHREKVEAWWNGLIEAQQERVLNQRNRKMAKARLIVTILMAAKAMMSADGQGLRRNMLESPE